MEVLHVDSREGLTVKQLCKMLYYEQLVGLLVLGTRLVSSHSVTLLISLTISSDWVKYLHPNFYHFASKSHKVLYNHLSSFHEA